MTVPVLTAVSDPGWEEQVISGLAGGDLGAYVVRRCVDLADLLATAATGQARAVVLSADLRRLDRDALSRLASCGVAVVGLVRPLDDEGAQRLRVLGVDLLLTTDSTPEDVSAAVVDAVATAVDGAQAGLAEPRHALADLPLEPGDDGSPATLGSGRLIAVWGPTGAPGRTTVAVGLATEAAALGSPTLLVDADPYGGVIAQVLGLLEESPGLAAAARLANNGGLDPGQLAGLARAVAPSLRVLTGIARADRWPELRPAAMEVVLERARSLAAVTVVDCGFCLERDEEISYDVAVPRRNGATLAVLEQADVVLAIGAADPVGLQRLVRGLAELKDAVPDAVPRVLVNRVRAGVIPGNAEAEIEAALRRFAGVEDVTFLPEDRGALDRALAAGRSLAEAAPGSPLRLALAGLAADLTGAARRPRRRRWLARR